MLILWTEMGRREVTLKQTSGDHKETALTVYSRGHSEHQWMKWQAGPPWAGEPIFNWRRKRERRKRRKKRNRRKKQTSWRWRRKRRAARRGRKRQGRGEGRGTGKGWRPYEKHISYLQPSYFQSPICLWFQSPSWIPIMESGDLKQDPGLCMLSCPRSLLDQILLKWASKNKPWAHQMGWSHEILI